MITTCLVACTNSDGKPALFRTMVSCTPDEFETGGHYESAKQHALNQGYTNPTWVADESDPGFVKPPAKNSKLLDESDREKIMACHSGHTLVGIAGTVAVLEEIKPGFEHAPFTAAFQSQKSGEWKRTAAYAGSIEEAYLLGLSHRQEGPNSQFTYFAKRMLGLEDAD